MERSCELERERPAPGGDEEQPCSLSACEEDEDEEVDESEGPCSMAMFGDDEGEQEEPCSLETVDESPAATGPGGEGMGSSEREAQEGSGPPAGPPGAVGGSSEDMEHEEEERALRELAQSPVLITVLSGLESLRSESGICSSLDSHYQETPEELERLEARLRQDKEAELERLSRELTRQKQLEIKTAISAKNEEIQRLRARLQADRERAASVAPGHREMAVQAHEQEVAKLKTVIRQLEEERDELKAEAQLCRIREKQRSAELRRQRQQHERELRHLLDETRRESVRESRDLARLRAVAQQKDKEIADREKQIYKLECQKCYLGEEIYRLTGVEEGFWSDQTMQRSSLTDRERGLVRRASQLGSQLSQLQVQCRTLKLDNKELRSAINNELDVPLTVRSKAAEAKREAQVLKKKNQELVSLTRKLEEKVKTLEAGSKETQRPERTRLRPARQVPQTRAVPVEQQLKTTGARQKTAASQEKTAGARQRTAPTAGAEQKQAGAQQRRAVAGQKAAVPQAKVATRPSQQRAGDQAGAEATLSRIAAPQQRATLTSRQREREADYQRQIKERNAEIRRLKQQMKDVGDRLSSSHEVQTLKEKGKSDLARLVQQLQKEKSELEEQLTVNIEALKKQREEDGEKLRSLKEENVALKEQLRDLSKVVQVYKELQRQFEDKIEECEQLSANLQTKEDLCNDLEKQFSRVIEKNTELTIQNSDLQRQLIEVEHLSTQCVSLKTSLTRAQADYGTAQMEVENLRGKVSDLESVLKQMRDAAEKKKELERQHQEARQQLEQKQAEVQALTKMSETERQAAADTIQALESKVRELEKKTEVQSLRHEELMLEMSSLKKQNKNKGWLDGSPEGTITPDSMLLSNESTARSTPVGTAVTPASLEALTEVDETPGWSQRHTDIQLPASTTARSVATSLELDKIMAKIENDNRVLAELDKNRSTIGLSNSIASAGSASTQPTFLTAGAPPRPAAYSQPPPAAPAVAYGGFLMPLPAPAGQQAVAAAVAAPAAGLVPPSSVAPAGQQLGQQLLAGYQSGKMGVVNGIIPGLLPTNLMHMVAPQTGVVDVLDIPGKGKCQVHIARYSYDPFQHSPNEAPESELRLNAGDYVLVWGDMDEDGFLDGETLDGRRGLVPSNFVQKLVGDDLLEFHRQVVAGLRDCDQTSVSTAVPHDLDFSSADEALLGGLDEPGPRQVAFGYDPAVFSDEEDQDFRGDSATVPPPRQLTLERQLNKSVVLGWSPAEAPPGAIDCYHVYVDGLLRTTVRATERTRALVEGVDSSRPHRVAVRSVTPDRRASRDAACTMLIGRDVPLAPTAVRATNITSTSAVISWMPSNSNFQHTVCVNNVEVRTVKPGVYRHTITGISPNTVYRVSVKVKNVVAPHLNNRSASSRERLATHIEFRTLPKGVPDPPVDVQCELGPQEGSVLVTWLPVTINSTSGTSNGVPVTGYAVYADGKKITELNSPTGDHALVELHQIHGFHPRQVTVRTKSRDLVSADSLPCPIPQRAVAKEDLGHVRTHGEPADSVQSSPRPRRQMPPTVAPHRGAQQNHQQVLDTEENLSDREAYPGNYASVPHIEVTKNSAGTGRVVDGFGEDEFESRGPWGPRRRPAERGRPASSPHQPGGGPESAQGMAAASPGRQPHGHRRPDGYGEPTGRGGRRDRAAADPGWHGDRETGYRPGPAHSSQDRRAGPRHQRMRVFVALFDYDPPHMSPNPDACEDELPFREGQLIKIYGEKGSDGFYWGEASGRAGYVPCNMISEVQMDDDRLAQEMLREEGHQSGRQRTGGGRTRGQEDRWGDIYASTPVRRMVALYDYDPQELSPNVDSEVELSFKTGDIIHVYGDMGDDGFYLGDINGVRGLVPSNFLTDAPQPSHERRRGHEPASERRPPPGPGVLGPPLPPRDKGDSRDRRKDGRADDGGHGDRDDAERRQQQRW